MDADRAVEVDAAEEPPAPKPARKRRSRAKKPPQESQEAVAVEAAPVEQDAPASETGAQADQPTNTGLEVVDPAPDDAPPEPGERPGS